MLHEKLIEQLTANGGGGHAASKLDIKTETQRWGNAATLLTIARETRIIEQGTAGYSSGPEYQRGAT